MTTPKTATLDAPEKSLPAPAPTGPQALALPETPSVGWLQQILNDDQIKPLCATVAPDATPDELAVFFWSAKRRGLDPFLKQIHFVKRRRYRGRDDNGKPVYESYAVHQTGIDGFRVIANRAKDPAGKLLLAGIKRGPIRDDKGQLIGAFAEVYRHDWKEPARAEVLLEEYVQTDDKGAPTGLWRTKPQTMLEKCGEAAAHRMAFPEDLADLYVHEELDNAEHVRPFNREEAGPVSSATAPQATILDAAGHVVPPVPEEEPAPARASNGQPGLFAEPTEAPSLAERAIALKAIKEMLASFDPRPKDETLAAIYQDALGTTDLAKADVAALSDLLAWMQVLKRAETMARTKQPFSAAETAAVARLRKIAGPKKADAR